MTTSATSKAALALTLLLASPGCVGTIEGEPITAEESELLQCSRYEQLTASVAANTLACRGTIDGDSFVVNDAGRLARNFETCTDGDNGLLQEIDAMLSIQQRTQGAPHAARCMTGRWTSWRADFRVSGINACPRWEKLRTINAPTAESIDAIIPALKADPRSVHSAHENYEYRVRSLPTAALPSGYADVASVAMACAGGLPGFVIEGKGDRVVGDPLYWLVATDYTGLDNPFMRAGYQHKMSYYGNDPGVIYGHMNRAGEYCTRFYDGVHYLMKLELECLVDSDRSSCASRCGPL